MKAPRRWIVVSIATALLLGAAWYGLHSASPREAAALPAGKVASPANSVTTAPPASSAGARRLPTGDDKEIADRETVVCGVGAVQLDPKDKAAPFSYVDRLTGIAQSQWRRSLINSDDYHERAAGLLLQSTGWDYDPITGMPTRTHDAGLARDELVQLAAGLNDLPVYAMAIRACDPADDGGVKGAACSQISLAKWADMDPDNAAPWLEMARAAHSRSDQAAELDAVNHAVQAHTVDFYNDMRDEVLAMFRAENYSGKDPWSCDNVRAFTEFASVQARSGEVAAARAAIQKSGKSIPQLAKEQTDSLSE